MSAEMKDMRWRRMSARGAGIASLGLAVIVLAVTLGLKLPELAFLNPFSTPGGLAYLASQPGEFDPLTAQYLERNGFGSPGEQTSVEAERWFSHSIEKDSSAPGCPSSGCAVSGNYSWEEAANVSSIPYSASEDAPSGRTQDDPTSCAPVGGSAWYTFTPSQNEGLVASTGASTHATALAVFTGDKSGPHNQIACAKDTQGSSTVSFAAIAETRYYFQVVDLLPGGRISFHLDLRPTVSLVSKTQDGVVANAPILTGQISPDGRFATFVTDATNLDRRCPCGEQVYVKDLASGALEMVSVSDSGQPSNSSQNEIWFGETSISYDGRYVAFATKAANLVPHTTNEAYNVYVRDRLLQKTMRVSLNDDGTEGPKDDGSFWPKLSYDGRYVFFESHIRGLDPAHPSVSYGIYRHDMETGRNELTSLGWNGAPDPNPAQFDISGDGEHVVWNSTTADNVKNPGTFMSAVRIWETQVHPLLFDNSCVALPAGLGCIVSFYANFWTGHLYVRDLAHETTVDACTSSDGTPANDVCQGTTLSADGRYASFTSSATNLITPSISLDPSKKDVTAGTIESEGLSQAYVKDLESGKLELVSQSSSGVPGGDSGDDVGNYPLTQLAPYVEVDGVAGRNVCACDPRRGPDPNHTVMLAGDGSIAAFDSEAQSLVSDKTSPYSDIFLRDFSERTTIRLSVSNAGAEGNAASIYPQASDDGRSVSFLSSASNLTTDATGSQQLFVWSA
ncbi:MAG: TolB family protein [Actinomycetota bacterium]